MKVLILAAGRGTRISRYLSGKPKCTVDIGGGQCLIEYTIDLLHSRGIQDIGIVLGYEAQVIREVLADKGVSFFYNPFYDVTNSIASAWFAKEFLTGDDLLIMNGDVYLEEKLLDRILAQGRSPVMFAPRRSTSRIGDSSIAASILKVSNFLVRSILLHTPGLIFPCKLPASRQSCFETASNPSLKIDSFSTIPLSFHTSLLYMIL